MMGWSGIDSGLLLIGRAINEPSLWPVVRRATELEYFSDPMARKLFAIMDKLHSKGFKAGAGDCVDAIAQRLDPPTLKAFAQIYDRLPITANIDFLLETFLHDAADRVADATVRQPDEDPVSHKRRVLDAVTAVQAGIDTERSAQDIDAEWEANAEARKSGQIVCVSTGLKHLDFLLRGGFEPGSLYILGARPSMGKTALAVNFAKACYSAGQKMIYATVEMTSVQIYDRLLSLEAGVPANKFTDSSQLSDSELRRIGDARFRLRQAFPVILNRFRARFDLLSERIENEVAKGKPGLVIIDHLHNLSSGPRPNPNPVQEIGIISTGLKQLALNLKIPILLLSQLSRRTETGFGDDDGAKLMVPTMADLRGSGSIEQDADVVMFIHREDYRNENAPPESFVVVAKNRNGGRTGRALLQHNLSTFKFEDRK